ncbi:MAG TPA: FG-GAP-like repeat-containing protein [Gammaproteobacteria bacterium]|nr:FG-GAP-like repeat-containing protein [Gammaproteobacteria bacterium]
MGRIGAISRVLLVIIFSTAALTACGGGSSGGDSGSSGTAGDGSVPDNPPPLVSPDYNGATAAVDIRESNAVILGMEMMTMVQNIAALAYDVPEPPSGEQTINRTQSGPDGGQAIIQGQINANGAGWVTIDYQDYQGSASGTSFTYNGEIQIRYDPRSPAYYRSPATVDLAGFTISTSAGSQTFTGTITKSSTVVGGTSKTKYTTDFAIFDHSLNASLKADYQIEEGLSDVMISGKLFDSRVGYITVATSQPMQFGNFDGLQTPKGGGSVRLSGPDSNVAILAGLNHYFGSIGIDSDGDGVADESTRIDWQIFGPDTTPTPSGTPEADVVSQGVAGIGETVKLDGRYSHSSNGDLVHFNWKLIAAPAGSAAELSDHYNAVATFIPDVAGDYLFRLEASGAAGSGRDAVVVQAYPADAVPSSEDSVPEVGPDRGARMGTRVALDGRASIDKSVHGVQWNWELHGPPDSQAVLNDKNVAQPTFTPDVAGYYAASLGLSGCCTSNLSHVVINVGGPVHFDPAVEISPNLDATYVALGDLNNDGLPDLAIGEWLAPSSVAIIYGRGNGHFSAPVDTSVGNGVRQIAVKDINGDGLADLITLPNEAGIDYRLQQPDGSLAPLVHIDDTSGASGCSAHVEIAKLFGATRNSVVTEGCSNYVEIYPPVAGGAIGAPVSVDIGATNYYGLAVADVTGDGIADLVTTIDYPSDALWVSAGRSDGTFSPAVVADSIDRLGGRMMIGDMNGDGRNDVVLPGNHSFEILFQQSGGSIGADRTWTTTRAAGRPAIGDINGDGLLDLVVGEQYFDRVKGLPRDETGLFIQGADGSLSREYLYPDFISNEDNKIIADLNGDGLADILTFGTLDDSDLMVKFGDPVENGPVQSTLKAQTLQVQSLEPGPKNLQALAQEMHGMPSPLHFRLSG